MSGFDTKATNLPKSEQVKPSHSTNVKAEDGKINCLLKPLSWNVVRCRLSDEGGTKMKGKMVNWLFVGSCNRYFRSLRWRKFSRI